MILPPFTGIASVLALVAALGLVVLQLLAGGLHLSRGEVKETGLNAALIVLAAVAAWLAPAPAPTPRPHARRRTEAAGADAPPPPPRPPLP